MSKYITSLLLICCLQFVGAQKKQIDLNEKDTITHMEPYGLRIGIDLSKKYYNNLTRILKG